MGETFEMTSSGITWSLLMKVESAFLNTAYSNGSENYSPVPKTDYHAVTRLDTSILSALATTRPIASFWDKLLKPMPALHEVTEEFVA